MKSKIIMSMLITSALSIPGVYAAQKNSNDTTHSAHKKCGSCSTDQQEQASPTPVPTPWNSFLNQEDLVENDGLVQRIMAFLTWRFRKDERLFQLGICTGQTLAANGNPVPLNQPLTQDQIQQVQAAKQTCFQQLNPSPTPSPSPTATPSPTMSPAPTVSPSPTVVPSATPIVAPTVVPSPSVGPVPVPTIQPSATPITGL